jgi:hypothetical protein
VRTHSRHGPWSFCTWQISSSRVSSLEDAMTARLPC